MGTVLGYLRPYGRRVACGVAIKFTAAVLELILPLLLAYVIDTLVPAGDPAAIWQVGGLMALLAFGAAGCNITMKPSQTTMDALNAAIPTDWQIKLGNLIVLRIIRIKIIFTVKFTVLCDGTVCCKSDCNGILYHLFI